MDEEKMEARKKQVEQMFDDMTAKNESEPEIKPIAMKGQTTLGALIESAGLDHDEMNSERFREVMRNLGENEKHVFDMLCMVLPVLVIESIMSDPSAAKSFEQLTEAYAEVSSVYTYAIVKMSASDNLDKITLPLMNQDSLVDDTPLWSNIERKVAMVVTGYCTALIAVTDKIVGIKDLRSTQGMLTAFASTIMRPLTEYVMEERQKNNLGG